MDEVEGLRSCRPSLGAVMLEGSSEALALSVELRSSLQCRALSVVPVLPLA